MKVTIDPGEVTCVARLQLVQRDWPYAFIHVTLSPLAPEVELYLTYAEAVKLREALRGIEDYEPESECCSALMAGSRDPVAQELTGRCSTCGNMALFGWYRHGDDFMPASRLTL